MGTEIVIYEIEKHKSTSYASPALKDPKLTWQEKGLHAYMTTLQEDITLEKLISKSGSGRDSTRRILNNLITKQYGIRLKLMDKNHRIIQWLYVCFPIPTKVTKKNIIKILNNVCRNEPDTRLWFVGFSVCNTTNVVYINTLLHKVLGTLKNKSAYEDTNFVESRNNKPLAKTKRRNLENPNDIFVGRDSVEKVKPKGKAEKLIAYWNSVGLRNHKDPNSKVYKDSKLALNKLLKGKFFNGATGKLLKENRKFTYVEIKKAIDRFAISAMNIDYSPSDKRILKRMSVVDFIFSNFNTKYKSTFLYYIKNEPKKLEVYRSLRQDDYPKTTQRLIDKLNNNGENVNEKDVPIMNQLIRTSILIQEFWQDNEDKFMVDWPIPTIIDKLITVSNGRGIMGLTTPMIYKTILPQELIKDKYMRRR